MLYKNYFIYFILLASFVFCETSVIAQEIAIVQNFDDPEIDSLRSYLDSMGLVNTVIHKDTLTYSSIANYDLVIWDDLGFQANGLNDSNVSVFNQFYQSGKPLYFIGDDLAYSIINLSQQWAPVWTSLIHLSGENNFSQAYNVLIVDTTHPVTNGAYGKVNNFEYNLDIDLATRTNTGEIVLARTTDSDVLLAFQGSQTRTVSQNCLVVQAGSETSIAERKKLFKNAVTWLLNAVIGVKNISSEVPKNFNLSQNYPNPFNPSTKFIVQVAKLSDVKIIVYDVLGREIAILVNQKLRAGIYEVSWDARNYSSGVYYYRLTAGNFVETKKMILLK
jgi:hypothetical protein